MDFQTVIFNSINEMLTKEDATDPAATPATGPTTGPKSSKAKYLGYGALGAVGLGAGYHGVKSAWDAARATPNIPNPIHSQAAEQVKQSAEQAKQVVAASKETVSQKMANAGDAVSNQFGAVKDAARSTMAHGADLVKDHPGAALAVGAVGTAAWLARRRALKNASRGI